MGPAFFLSELDWGNSSGSTFGGCSGGLASFLIFGSGRSSLERGYGENSVESFKYVFWHSSIHASFSSNSPSSSRRIVSYSCFDNKSANASSQFFNSLLTGRFPDILWQTAFPWRVSVPLQILRFILACLIAFSFASVLVYRLKFYSRTLVSQKSNDQHFFARNQDDPLPKNIIRSEIKIYNIIYLTKSSGNKTKQYTKTSETGITNINV